MVRGPLHGIARYALELARRIPPLEPGWQFVGLTGPSGVPGDLGELAPRIPLVKCSADFLAPAEQPALAAALARLEPDLFHATSFSVPALWWGPLVATLHDANHLALPEGRSRTRTAYYRLVVGPRARRARALITVSEFSRLELARHLELPGERLQVISNGVDAAFRAPPPSELDDFRARRGLPPRYFAAIGSIKPHKNMKVLRSIATALPAPLALLAGRGARRALGFDESVLELSPLPDADLVRFYAAACAVLVPSYYEGFGLPALEAMACGGPVIAADAGAHREVVGSAGLLVDPHDEAAWKAACQRVFRDEALRRQLSEAGITRASRFSWDECAQRTLQVYRRAMGRA
ncbi:MAG: glycosyltransferase family 4 protein [Myxococcaceae bacterium]|nr:glycosyltransferase family 4 protein [Myxococcaceae bacterium]